MQIATYGKVRRIRELIKAHEIFTFDQYETYRKIYGDSIPCWKTLIRNGYIKKVTMNGYKFKY